MKKSILSALLIFSLLAALICPAQAADYDLLMGDIDGSATITAGDARTILRASVALESLNNAKSILADVNFDGTISATDARLVLRTSVGLEKIDNFRHKHTMQDISTQGSCTEMTIDAEQCTVCKTKNVISVVPAPGHAWNPYIRLGETHSRDCKVCGASESGKCELVLTVNRPATCTEDGLVEYACVCGLKEQTVTKGEHSYSAWTKAANGSYTSTCSGCADTKTATQADILAWFNGHVNRLKNEENTDRRVTLLRYTDTTNKTSDFSLSIQLVLGLEALLKETLDSEKRAYTVPNENRTITKNIFPAMTQDYVSCLTVDDIKSMDIRMNQTVNVLHAFPQSFDITRTVNGAETTTTYDISDYKNTAPVTDAIKISIQINDEQATATGQLNGTTNVYSYASGGKAVSESQLVMERFYGLGLPSLCSQFPQKDSMDGSNMYIDCPSASSAGTTDWYFDSKTLEPIACVYTVNFNMLQAIALDSTLLNGDFKLTTDILYTYVFLFNDYYPCMAE